MQRLVVRLAVGLATVCVFAAAAGQARAAGGAVVLSQVYGGGGNAGATYKNDFIQLYNHSGSDVSLNGWSVQYASSAGSSWTNKTVLSGSIVAGGTYLIKEAAGAGGTADVPNGNATGTINLSGTTGKVALVSSSTTLPAVTCPTGNGIVDFVGYGGANCFEGSGPAPATTNSTAAVRKGNGATDTDDNAADFFTGAPSPVAGDQAPGVASTDPANNAADVDPATNLTVTFTEPVSLDSVWFTITCSVSGPHSAQVLPGTSQTTFTLDPDTNFVPGEDCTTVISATAVHDVDSSDPPDTMSADFTWRISTTAPPVTIEQIQGSAQRSPYDGKTVSGVRGIVTAVNSTGFWMQDPAGDGDPSTSDGIHVYKGSAVAVGVGDSVKVAGRVNEYVSSGSGDLPATEIESPTVVKLSTGNPLPAPVLIGQGGLTPPQTSVVDGIAFDEPLEGMLVEFDDLQAVSPTNSFGEVWIVPNFGAGAAVMTPRGGILLQADDVNPEKFRVDDDVFGGMPHASVGATSPGAHVGVMDYAFDNYTVHLTERLTWVDSPIQREVSSQEGGGDRLTVATFNLENLAPQNPQSKFDALAAELVNNLRSPDIVAFEEVQDNTGATDHDGVVDSTQTLAKFDDAIQAAGGPRYQFAWVNPEADQDGGQPGGNIRVVFAWRSDVPGLSLAPGTAGGTHDANAVVGTGPAATLQYNPGRIDPESPAWEARRKPIAAKFVYNGHALFAIANHFISKGGDEPMWGEHQPADRSSEVQRHQQAHEVADFVSQLLAAAPDANVIALGDLNDFQWSETVQILGTAGLHDALDELPLAERYSYVFDGNSQALDHMLVGGGLVQRPHTYDPVHVNSEFWDQASDHDPEVMGITLGSPTVTAAPATVAEGGSTTLTVSGTDQSGGALTYAWDLDNDGSYETPGAAPVFSAAAIDGPATRTVGVQATAPDGVTATSTTTVTVKNVAPTGTFDAPAAALALNAFTLSLTGVTDPSAADTAQGFTYAFDCGSGLGAFGSASTATCTAADTGTVHVRGAVQDKDGGVTVYDADVTVSVTVDSLCATIAGWAKNAGQANSLCVKLRAGQIEAFGHEVDAQTGKAFSADQAALLKRLAGRL